MTASDVEDDAAAEGAVEFQEGDDVGQVPSIPKEVAKATKTNKDEPGVIFVSHLPHGFYEHQLRDYFEQFGQVNRVRLSRNKKTGMVSACL